MVIMGILLIGHGCMNLFAALGGAVGYNLRGLWRDAVGVTLTIGIAAAAEIAFGVSLIR